MVESGRRVCAFGLQAAQKGNLEEISEYPSIGHYDRAYRAVRSRCNAICSFCQFATGLTRGDQL